MIKNILKSIFFVNLIFAFIFAIFVILPKSEALAQACPSGQSDPHNVCAGVTGGSGGSGTVYTCTSQGGCGVSQCTSDQECATLYCPPPPNSCPDPQYTEGILPSTSAYSYSSYTNGIPPDINNTDSAGGHGVVAVTSTGKAWVHLIGSNVCISTGQPTTQTNGRMMSISHSSITGGGSVKPILGAFAPLPGLNAAAQVSGNNATTGKYTTNITTTHDILPPNNTYPLDIYVVNQALPLGASCTGNLGASKPTGIAGQPCNAATSACQISDPDNNYVLTCSSFSSAGVWNKGLKCTNNKDCNPSNNSCDGLWLPPGGHPVNNTASNVTLTVPNFQIQYNGSTVAANVICYYMDGVFQSCYNADVKPILNVPNGSHTFQAFGWYSAYFTCLNGSCSGGGPPNGAIFAGTVAETTLYTTNGLCGATPPPLPVFSINGKVYKDVDGSGTFTGGSDTPYAGATICLNSSCTGANARTTDSSGQFSYTNLASGQYTISVSPPSGYQGIVPGPPAAYTATFGPGCDSSPVPGRGFPSPYCYTSANQTDLNLTNVFFLISNSSAWIQSTGSDIRIDNGFNYTIPAASYMSTVGSGSTPGIIFAGDGSSISSNQASVNKWLVGGSASGYPETYSPTNTGAVRTSYNYVLNAAKGTTILNLATQVGGCSQSGTDITCDTSNAAWNPANLAHGTYQANGNLILNGPGITFSGNKNFVFLVNGDLQINEEIHVTIGSTAFFTTSGSIKVASSVGQTTPTVATSNLEGYYSADKDFIALGNTPSCSPADERLNIAGAVVANASLGGYEFDNRRDLCAGNSNPSFTVTERPDFILNSPSLVLNSKRIFREVAP